jgi:hypothetical protein
VQRKHDFSNAAEKRINKRHMIYMYGKMQRMKRHIRVQ